MPDLEEPDERPEYPVPAWWRQAQADILRATYGDLELCELADVNLNIIELQLSQF